ncbi:MAG TPA: lipoyl(octanoyl) transferase LipB [Bacillota bacterium]|nr:lipoyl(octanoyl) transferase LipB [Bacillota bacterium]HPL98666.1 lipoyl(octanoyl) transferase LipB [Bacillota bacterium]HPW40554.1 lipoyl(octanoyl) transferase LipB [Bacillota bacterium]
MKLNVLNLGRCDYKKALDIQYDILEKRQKDELGDTLILVEHPPVITLGRHGAESNIVVPEQYLKNNGIDVYHIERGGDVTYHGHGQIVGYPIVSLRNNKIGIREFVEKLENTFILLLKEQYGIDSGINPDFPGVWVGNNKITALGLAVKRGVTMHGFAFNVNTNLEHFKLILPCGISGKGVTSLEKLTGSKVDFNQANKTVVDYFCKTFGYEGTEELYL